MKTRGHKHTAELEKGENVAQKNDLMSLIQ